jgi:lipoprotein-anchoring transpeptidase ErfK/SrfK
MLKYFLPLFMANIALAGQMVYIDPSLPPKTIIIKQSERRLYYVESQGLAIAYPVAVGKAGKAWQGTSQVDGKHLRPAWSPPPEVKRDMPSLPNVIAGGAPNNPMGEAALTLVGGDYAIHGTNRPESIGRAASYGCIRMFNHDVLDLYQRVKVGTMVYVMN